MLASPVMADLNDKHPQGVLGRYYTDHSCVGCDYCRELAPEVFRADEEDLTYVWRQPQTVEEIDLAEEALEGCPTETIGRISLGALAPNRES